MGRVALGVGHLFADDDLAHGDLVIFIGMGSVIFLSFFRGYLGLVVEMLEGRLRFQLLLLEGQFVNKLGRLVEVLGFGLMGERHD